MEKFRATSKHSKIELVTDRTILFKNNQHDIKIIQLMQLEGTELIVIEYIEEKDIEKYLEENNRQATASLEAEDTQKPKKTDEQMQLENDLETILNSDPFSKGKYSGKTLRYIYENDIKWVEYAIEHLNNTYIKDKLINIKKCESLWL